MRAHGKGSEGSEKRGGGAKKEMGCEKKGVQEKGGARSTGTPPVYATANNKLFYNNILYFLERKFLVFCLSAQNFLSGFEPRQNPYSVSWIDRDGRQPSSATVFFKKFFFTYLLPTFLFDYQRFI